jgi:hypothetical protein
VASDKFYRKEEAMEETYIDYGSLTREKLIFDVPKLTTLAILSHSLEWLAQKLSALADSSTQFGHHGHSASLAALNNSIDVDAPYSEELYQQIGSRMKNPEQMELVREALKLLSVQFKDLYQRCLISLRLEYRLHCYFFLDGIKSASYWFETESSEPDHFIHELNKDLAVNEECISTYTPPQKTR